MRRQKVWLCLWPWLCLEHRTYMTVDLSSAVAPTSTSPGGLIATSVEKVYTCIVGPSHLSLSLALSDRKG